MFFSLTFPPQPRYFSAWSISSFRSWSSFSVCLIALLVFLYRFFISDTTSCNSKRAGGCSGRPEGIGTERNGLNPCARLFSSG
ncbi:hypothetical protein BRYFOR_06000 [Marvinbryantia formatexigens DSM 14469]|uniref:Uncharacterized protein n=1 Tax=Marvinbryantia formatexigens DSM 14469 TaxID=478749 RepID=C6LBK6_9FIRM|nr:hypothetical protein BRYFOR_06000 [Marvinbryantia formatexigens DSM 14469]